MAVSSLCDRRILVVEDEYLIAFTLSDRLEGVGSIVVGPVPSVERAIKTVESNPEIDAAILDVNLGGAKAYPVADALLAGNIPFVFASGYEETVNDSPISARPPCDGSAWSLFRGELLGRRRRCTAEGPVAPSHTKGGRYDPQYCSNLGHRARHGRSCFVVASFRERGYIHGAGGHANSSARVKRGHALAQ